MQIFRKKLFYPLLGILIIILVLSTLFLNSVDDPITVVEDIEVTLNISFATIQSNLSYTLQSFTNTSVFELLNKTVIVSYDKYGFAYFVTGINGVYQNNNITGYFWIYYINDIKANVASNDYLLKSGDQILWNYESGNQL